MQASKEIFAQTQLKTTWKELEKFQLFYVSFGSIQRLSDAFCSDDIKTV
jgi:hypothetical protein